MRSPRVASRCAYPLIGVIGVRSSWEMVATKSVFIRSTRRSRVSSWTVRMLTQPVVSAFDEVVASRTRTVEMVTSSSSPSARTRRARTGAGVPSGRISGFREALIRVCTISGACSIWLAIWSASTPVIRAMVWLHRRTWPASSTIAMPSEVLSTTAVSLAVSSDRALNAAPARMALPTAATRAPRTGASASSRDHPRVRPAIRLWR